MIDGFYSTGGGKFHLNMKQFEEIFNCPMIGSFNVKTEKRINDFPPTFGLGKKFNHQNATGGIWFWLLKLDGIFYGWAVRWGGSKQRETTWEIISKEPFPDRLKSGKIEIDVLEKWPPGKIKDWDKTTYQWQTFPFTSIKRADSHFLWNAIQGRGEWSGATVLDYGCNFGYHSQMAAENGARVIGYDSNPKVIEKAKQINDHIVMNDCRFQDHFPVGSFDYILYLSVHHQPDPEYRKLDEKISQLKAMAKRKLFVELIVPAFNGGLNEKEIDAIMGGQGFLKYRHKVRAIRKVYEIKGVAS